MYESEEFTDIAGTIGKRALPEEFSPSGDLNTAVFEWAGVTAARGINSIAVRYGFTCDGETRLASVMLSFGGCVQFGMAGDELIALAAEGFLSQFEGAKSLVAGT